MEETYCGKSCESCSQREAMNCPGCVQGPGKPITGTCSLAICCRKRGHDKCNTCTDRYGCNMLYNRNKMPEQRRRFEESVIAMQERLQRSGRLLGKWLWLLFWMIIPSTVSVLLSYTQISVLMTVGEWLGLISSAAYCLILLRLSTEDDHYKYAGIGLLVGNVVNLLQYILGRGEPQWWLQLLAIPAAIALVVAEYNELTAHSLALVDVDDDLSDKWMALRKWYVITYLATLGNVFIMMISLLLSAMLLLATSIGIVIISVFKLVYLFRTAKAFRDTM